MAVSCTLSNYYDNNVKCINHSYCLKHLSYTSIKNNDRVNVTKCLHSLCRELQNIFKTLKERNTILVDWMTQYFEIFNSKINL